jgi:SAM-dependent methyltransferase
VDTADERVGTEGDVAAVLRAVTDQRGRHPLPWAVTPLAGAARVLDVSCGSGPLADELAERWIGVDPLAAPGRRPLLRGSPAALPLRDNAVDGIALFLVLQRLPDLDAVFAELRRVLRPGGTLVAVVPSAAPRTLAELRLAPLLVPVHREWRHRSALDAAGWLLTAADFAVLTDDRAAFTVPLPDGPAARTLVTGLPHAGLWPPELPAGVRDKAADALVRRAGPGRRLPVPMRRLVARR